MRKPLVLLLLVAACISEPGDQDEIESASSALTNAAIPRGSTWRYWDRGGDLGAAWRGAFDDAAWASGAGPLGYGESYLRTTVGYGPSASNKYVTTYFRKSFSVADPAAITAITGEVMFDDGIVVYINGTRIGRDSMPSGTTTASTLATGHEANNAYATYDWTAQKSLLVAGSNVIAVEVHQSAASSSDLVFDLSLTLETAEPPPPPVEFEDFRREAHWWYWDNGGDLGTAWRYAACCPDGWDFGQGVFGFGESYVRTTVSPGPSASARNITTYFTSQTYLSNPAAVTSMIAEVMYDDGFVAYLNGVEIARASMPAGPINASTLALGHEANNAYQTFDLTAMRGALRMGQNILAVEVHQSSTTSSDLVFDMALRLYGEEPPPPSAEEDIARRSAWAYWDRTEAPSQYSWWRETEYNDAVWKRGAGPLGYGETYLGTTISYGSNPSTKPTAYFRRWFTVDAPSVQTRMIAELMYDDGVVVYLNGAEISRLSMPAGSIEPTTLATGHEANNSYQTFDWSALNHYLVPGPNLLAVEVHQSSPSSSDLVFDLSLQIDTPPVCAVTGGGPGVAPPARAPLNGVWVGPTEVWTVGGDGAIGRRTDAGGTWCWSAPDPAVTLNAVWGAAVDDVWIVGDGGRVYHFDGSNLTTVDIGTAEALADIWGSGPDDIWVVGRLGTVRHYDGTSWSGRGLPADQTLMAVWGASADEVWVGGTEPAPYPDPELSQYDGSSGTIYRWDPTTASWRLELKTTMYYGYSNFEALDGTGAADIWAVGGDHPAGAACSQSHAWHYDGASWSWIDFPDELSSCRHFEDVAAGAPGAADGAWIAGGGEAGALRYQGGVWTAGEEPITTSLTSIDHDGTRMWAAGGGWDGQKLIHWDGARWIQEW